MQQVGEHNQRGQQRGQELFAMAVVMLEAIAIGFQRIVVFIFNFPPCTPRSGYFRDVGAINRQGGGKRISVQHLSIVRAGGDLTPQTMSASSASRKGTAAT